MLKIPFESLGLLMMLLGVQKSTAEGWRGAVGVVMVLAGYALHSMAIVSRRRAPE
jgi:hypothetical protein